MDVLVPSSVVLHFKNHFISPVNNENPDDLEGKDATGPNSFYKVYQPVFERNKRFAVILPAPSLGEDDTPIDEVRDTKSVERLDTAEDHP